jgi:hypothetical protein
MFMGDNGINDNKNAGKSTTILIPMPPGQYGVMCIARWGASMASCKPLDATSW